MFIQDLVNADELPVLEQSLRFAAQRQKILAHNIANIDTPGFRTLDVSPGGFQRSLAKAIDARRDQWGGTRGELEWAQTTELRKNSRGLLELKPTPTGDNILFHDRSNTSLEELMQGIQENTAAFALSAELMRAKMDLLRTAVDQTR